MHPKGEKRKAAEMESPGSVLSERHRQYLQRGKAPGISSYRPKKLYRLSAKHWVVHTDNQLRHSTWAEGWVSFQLSDTPVWSPDNWQLWPHIAAASDQGSDGLSAGFALENHYNINISRFADFGHGAHKDMGLSLKAIGLWDFVLTAMISANVLHGPHQDDWRYTQIRDSMKQAYSTLSEKTPLFAELAPAIHSELANAGHQWSGELPLDTEVWNHCKARDPFTNKSYHLKLNRFMASLQVMRTIMLPRWSLDLWERQFVCIEHDMLTGKVAKLLLKPGAAEEFGEGGGSTSSALVSLEDRSVRSCLQNALVISCLFLQDPLNRRKMQIIVGVGAHLELWHGHQSRDLRSGPASLEFMLQQVVQGRFFDHINNMLLAPSDESLLLDAGFVIPQHLDLPNVNDLKLIDDELGAILGKLSLSMAFCRLRRCLWLFSWPHRIVQVLDSTNADEVAASFLADKAILEELVEYNPKFKVHKDVIARHVHNLVVNKQYAHGLDASMGKASPQFKALIQKHYQGLITTQIVEDGFGVMKNATESKASTRFRRPERAMGKVLTSNVLDERHKYTPVPTSARVAKTTKLDSEAWQVKESVASIPVGEMVSTSQSPPWHSPSATNYCQRDADLWMLRAAKAHPQSYKVLRFAWLGDIFELSHEFIFKMRDAAGVQHVYIPGHHYPDSAVLALEVDLVQVPGKMEEFVQVRPLSKPILLSIFSLLDEEGIEGASTQWVSWLGQCTCFSADKAGLAPAVRMFVEGAFMPFRMLMARRGFWSLPKTVVAKYAEYFGIDVPSGGTTFEALLDK